MPTDETAVRRIPSTPTYGDRRIFTCGACGLKMTASGVANHGLGDCQQRQITELRSLLTARPDLRGDVGTTVFDTHYAEWNQKVEAYLEKLSNFFQE